mgnify:CR=1 FL=1
MRKTYKCSLLALSVLASFTSCSESESLQQANLSKDKITFHATLDNSWKPMSPASSSRAAIAAATEKGPIVVPTPFGKPLYLHSVVQETADLQQAAATTRGAMQEGTTLNNTYYNNSFGVTAISKDNGTNTALFTNQKASKNNEDIWEIEDKTNSRWPFDALVYFHAYAPFNDATDDMWSVTTDTENVKTKIKYTAKSGETEILSQPDIIVATNAESRSVSSDDKAVELKFSHALTAVNFAISKDLTDIFKTGATDGSKLKSITLSGIPNVGTCELTAKEGAPQTPSQTWTFDTEADGAKKTGTYTFNLENKNITIGESYALTSNEDKNILMMIPQNLQGTNAQLIFVLDIKGKGDQTYTFDLSNQNWLPGTSVTYKLSASAVNHLENAEVKFPESWNGVNYPKTDFAAGESIGLYVVNSNNAIEEANVKLTRDQDGKWMPENNNTKFLKLKNYKYFAYYPYNAAAPTVDPMKDNASTFFASKISSLSPASDQSTQNTLLAQDFQVAKGVVASDASTLTFLMEHAMGLAEITLGAKTFDANYRLSNYYDYTWKKITTFHACARISGYSFYKVADYRYVALVKPNVTTGFSCGDKTDLDAWTEDVLNVKPVANSVAKVTATSKRDPNSYILYTMKVGDIYYSDGAMTHQSEDLASGKTPIGIVGYTGSNYWTEKDTKEPGIGGHALVMCLKTIGSKGSPKAAQEDYKNNGINGETYKAYIGTGYAWAPSDDDAGRELIDSREKLVESYNKPYGSGYTETAALIKKWNTKAAAAYQAQKYNTLPANSPKCTGWFLPTAGQYYAVMTTLGAQFSSDWTGIYDGVTSTHQKFGFFSNMTTVTTNINNKLKKVGDDLKYTEFFGNINTWAWTSSQLRSTDAVYIDSGIDDPHESGANGSVRFFYANYKNSALLPPVRPFLAF